MTDGPQSGIVYTPEEVAQNFLRTMTSGALRKAAQERAISHTRVRGHIGFTSDDIAAILAAGHRPAKDTTRIAPASRRTPARPAPPLPEGVTELVAKPGARRRKRSDADRSTAVTRDVGSP